MNKIYVIGIGPGDYDNMTIKADKILRKCDVIAGYQVYVELVKEHYPDKEFLTTPMKQEALRCKMAFEEARTGKTVAMISSGDAGIYGMAGLMFEIGEEYDDIEVEIIGGVTAASSGGAILGAPLIHDFAVISLSDLLTPRNKIDSRIEHAAKADFNIVIYNPSSKKRKDYLRESCEILLSILPENRICGIARNIGRVGESYELCTLKELKDKEVDMFSTIFIGNSNTKIIGNRMVTPRGYSI